MEYQKEHASIWQTTVSGSHFEPLRGDREVDVAVIGAGITGLSAAVLLSRAGKRVAVIERDRVASGATGSTSAHLTSMNDLGYGTIAKKYGPESARLVSESMIEALNRIEGFIRELGIGCAYSRIPGYYISEDKRGAGKVKGEFEAARKAGLPVTMTGDVPLPFPAVAAFRIENQALFHPIAYCNGLARAIMESGSQVFTGTAVQQFSEGEPCVVQTELGTVRARDIFLATHTPLGVNPLQGELSVERSYAIAVRMPSLNIPALFWNTRDPYDYWRPFLLPDGTETLIAGGKDHAVGHGNPQKSLDQLIKYTRDRFSFDQVLNAWSAQHYDPTDSLPFIGKNPSDSHIYVATGLSGDGLVLGTLAGMLVTDLIIGTGNRFADLYKPARLKLSSLPEFVSLNVHNAKMFLQDHFKSGKTADKLAPGEAAVHGATSPVASYRDESGGLHVRSGVCKHLQCVVHWNDMEKTWDCPCHGSRYRIEGEIIEGPALQGLDKKQVKR